MVIERGSLPSGRSKLLRQPLPSGVCRDEHHSHPTSLSPLPPPSLPLLLLAAPAGTAARCMASTLLRHSGQLYCGCAKQCERRQ